MVNGKGPKKGPKKGSGAFFPLLALLYFPDSTLILHPDDPENQ